ncbi:Gustatory receptor 46 [Frankliniella occidentalis]|uniref:Uncharacterized protein LOC127749328 isoform X2 n=1 Tax=Frankliniella occidentalis TaxID=133901 RepID=A0A9C6WY86_FRAOC|nr:uncharacterized protein LOC127749328 isoform X2 [Frankliniella occidentalis]KAE8747425.1 Gustatory receptor 46 [Frankliniella occidentalis]
MAPDARGHTVAMPRRHLVWNAIQPALRIAQICSLLFISLASPVTKLPSLHAAYAVLMTLFIMAIGGAFVADFLQTPPSERHHDSFRFLVAVPAFFGFVAMVLLWVRVAGRWMGLWVLVDELEDRLWGHGVHRLPRLHRRARNASYAIVLVAIVQNTNVLVRRLPASGLYEWALLVCSLCFSVVFNFNALLLIVLSYALAECFRAFTVALESSAQKCDGRIPPEAMEDFRVLYNKVCGLSLALDHCVSPVILVAIFTDGLYICRFILLSLAVSAQNWSSTMLATISLFRFVWTILAASSVHSEWQSTKSCLHGIVPCRRGVEATRFFTQIVTERISLTALEMVPITKPLLPAVLGAILSYEIILVQFQLQKLKLVLSH